MPRDRQLTAAYFLYPEHTSPLNASKLSLAMRGTITSAATGSAHQRPNAAFSSKPASRIPDSQKQNSLCFASAPIAALPSSRATFLFACASSGMATSEAQARTMPGRLRSGALLQSRSLPDSKKMYAASARKQMPTMRNARCSLRSRRSASWSTAIRQSSAPPDASSMKLSIPNAVRDMLPATAPAAMATMPSTAFHPMVRYSSLRPRRTRVARSALETCSMLQG